MYAQIQKIGKANKLKVLRARQPTGLNRIATRKLHSWISEYYNNLKDINDW